MHARLPVACAPGRACGPVVTFLVRLFASGFFLGYIPVAPGTFGSLIGIPLAVAQARLVAWGWWAPFASFALFVCVASWIAGRAEKVFGRKDSSRIVIDEVAGYLAATLFLPATWGVLLAAFAFFRLFDVLKPFPAAHIDRQLHGGWGVVLDDVVAGIYAQACVRLLVVAGWL